MSWSRDSLSFCSHGPPHCVETEPMKEVYLFFLSSQDPGAVCIINVCRMPVIVHVCMHATTYTHCNLHSRECVYAHACDTVWVRLSSLSVLSSIN